MKPPNLHPEISHAETVERLEKALTVAALDEIRRAYRYTWRRKKCSFADFACGYVAARVGIIEGIDQLHAWFERLEGVHISEGEEQEP